MSTKKTIEKSVLSPKDQVTFYANQLDECQDIRVRGNELIKNNRIVAAKKILRDLDQYYERIFSERRAFQDETLELTLRVSNWKLLPVGWLQVEDQFPLGVPLLGEELFPSQSSNFGHLVTAFSLRWYERVTRRYRLHCPQRGFYRFGPAHLKSGDLFGLFSQEGRQEKDDWLIVYPKVVPIAQLGLLG